jgi:TatD DNase family protein
MKIFDSHCHLNDHAFAKDFDTVLERAHQADVKAMLIVGVDRSSSVEAVSIAGQHQNIYASVGMHPHDVRECSEPVLNELRELAADHRVVAWGETGLDFNRMFSPRDDQEHWFARQLEIGADLELPMIFHERDSRGRFLEILKLHWDSGRRGVVHCFSGNSRELDAYLDLGMYIGITGIITLKARGRELRNMVRRIPADRLLVETDAPYLTPTPERNKFRRNEPAFVRTVLFKLADVLGETPEELASITWNNTYHFLGLDAAGANG